VAGICAWATKRIRKNVTTMARPPIVNATSPSGSIGSASTPASSRTSRRAVS
jgi:hypothetical protein